MDAVARLCCMNLLLHGIGGDGTEAVPIDVRDSLGSHGGTFYEVVLTNPPFGKKISVTIVNEEGEAGKESLVVSRDDFWASTSNKQLNFLQHVFTLLKQHGRAAIVVPDNVLFEGGAGETIRRKLLHECRRPYPAAPAYRDLLRAGREGERAVLRPQAGRREAVDREALDLRPAHEQALHAQGEPAQARRPGRVRRLLSTRRTGTSARKASVSARSPTMT